MSRAAALVVALWFAISGCRRDDRSACGTADLLQVPADPAQPGPWPVGVRTLAIDGVTVEVWYPARPESDRGLPRVRYDLRGSMPPAEAAKIPDVDNAWLDCPCTRDLPVDDAHGPYPAIVFLHGAASFRAQSASLVAHWASRGFVVLAPEMPGIGLAATMGGPSEFPLELPTQLVELVLHPRSPDPLAFVRAHLGDRVALAGHSLGALLANSVSDRPGVAVRIALAGASPNDGSAESLLVVGDHDRIAGVGDARSAPATAHARRVVIHGAGHLAFSDLCSVGAGRGGAVAIARAHGVEVPDLVASLADDGCRPDDAPAARTAPAIRAATTAVLEESLRCDASATGAITALPTRFDIELFDRAR